MGTFLTSFGWLLFGAAIATNNFTLAAIGFSAFAIYWAEFSEG